MASTSSARSRTYSMSAMFRPTSPIPPRKTSRQLSGKETGVLQSLANAVPLVARRGDQRQPRLAARTPDHLERRLERDRVGRHEERVEQRRQRLVDLPSGRNVTRLDE